MSLSRMQTRDARGDRAQAPVSGEVAETIVDPLEAVYVDHAQCERAAVAPGEADLALQRACETAAVRRPGQGVAGRGLARLTVA